MTDDKKPLRDAYVEAVQNLRKVREDLEDAKLAYEEMEKKYDIFLKKMEVAYNNLVQK